MASPMALPEVVTKGQGLPDILDVAWKNRWLVGLSLILCTVLGQLAYLQAGPAYEAKARILVSKRGQIQLKEDDQGAVTYGERSEHVTLIMSPLIVEEAIREHHLNELPSMRGSDDPVDDILLKLKARRSAGSDLSFINVIDLQSENEDPGDATAILAAVIKTYTKYLDRTQNENTNQTLLGVEERSQDLEKELRALEQAQQKYREEAPLHWRSAPGASGQSGDTTNLHQERVLRLEQERRDKLIRRTEVHTKLQGVERARKDGTSRESLELLVRRYLSQDGNASPAASASSQDRNHRLQNVDPRFTIMDQRLTPLMLEEQKLLIEYGYGPDHPDVKLVRESIQRVRQFYRQQGLILLDEPGGQVELKEVDLVEIFVESLKQELAELDHRDRELATLVESESKLAKDYSKFQLEDQRLSNEIQRLNTLWQTVKTGISQVDLLKDSAGYNLKIVSPPKEALSAKKPMKYLGGGFVLGGLLGVAIAYLRALRDTRIKTVEELQRVLGLRVLGRVPQLTCTAADIRVPGVAASVCFVHQPGSSDAEAYRAIRSALFVMTQQQGRRVIQITSPEMGDGKTTSAVNLAAAIAQSGKKVLLIDADLRRPQVHALLGIRGDVGLSEVLRGEIRFENALQNSAVQQLTVLPAGSIPAQPSELLSHGGLETLFKQAREMFDFVLVDTPPLLAVSDASVVAPEVEGVLLVVRLGKNRSAVARRAEELLRTQGAMALGAVANGGITDEEQSTSGYYGPSAYVAPRMQAIPATTEMHNRPATRSSQVPVLSS